METVTVTVESKSTRDYVTITRPAHVYVMADGVEMFDILYKDGVLIINTGGSPLIIKPSATNQATIARG